MPVFLARGGTVRLQPPALQGVEEVPPGFVRVSLPSSDGAGTVSFLAARLEVTHAEYWEFLQDPRTRAEADAHRTGDLRFVPRGPDGPISPPDQPAQFPERPVTNVSLFDLAGYPTPPAGETDPLGDQRERARRVAATGVLEPDVVRRTSPDGSVEVFALRFTLPSEAEWAAMAGAADGRAYVFGDGFDWGCFKGACSRRTLASPLFPDDESVLGVRDLTGSVAEWTATWYEAQSRFVVRGGSYNLKEPAAYRVAARVLEEPRTASLRLGFRVVVRTTESVR
jgi:formylglycine-generating enzyme required for sulfatase activity